MIALKQYENVIPEALEVLYEQLDHSELLDEMDIDINVLQKLCQYLEDMQEELYGDRWE